MPSASVLPAGARAPTLLRPLNDSQVQHGCGHMLGAAAQVGHFCCLPASVLPAWLVQPGAASVIDPTAPLTYPAFPAPACGTLLGVAAIVLFSCNMTGPVGALGLGGWHGQAGLH